MKQRQKLKHPFHTTFFLGSTSLFYFPLLPQPKQYRVDGGMGARRQSITLPLSAAPSSSHFFSVPEWVFHWAAVLQDKHALFVGPPWAAEWISTPLCSSPCATEESSLKHLLHLLSCHGACRAVSHTFCLILHCQEAFCPFLITPSQRPMTVGAHRHPIQWHKNCLIPITSLWKTLENSSPCANLQQKPQHSWHLDIEQKNFRTGYCQAQSL